MIRFLLKVTFALGIVVWLVLEGQLDFSLIRASVGHLDLLLWGFILLVVQSALVGLRWKILLETKSKGPLPILRVININWIGLFFSALLPGVVTGDLVKLLYARDIDSSLDKTFLIMSMILDRALGLSGLILLMGFFSLVNYHELVALGPKMKALLSFNALLFLAILLFLAVLFLPLRMRAPLIRMGGEIPLLGSHISKTLKQVWIVGTNKKAVGRCLLLSVLIQFIHIAAFWIITSPFYVRPLEFSWAFALIPLGDIAIALPISPAGIGVGHVAFQSLFELVGIDNGANLFNLYFLVMVSVYLLGLFPYLLAGRRHSIEEVKGLQD